jgi:hypothetical protein
MSTLRRENAVSRVVDYALGAVAVSVGFVAGALAGRAMQRRERAERLAAIRALNAVPRNYGAPLDTYRAHLRGYLTDEPRSTDGLTNEFISYMGRPE